ncbi:MAG TPA: leucine--tRNA ligase [bacterium]|nr:leucine--tRNA ligase [bacterium]
MESKYIPGSIEPKWQRYWADERVFEVEADLKRPKYYLLEMFPYPSGRCHMGHVRNYSIGDVVSRYKVMRGFNVLHPMGWDAFGLPAENAAIENRVHPNTWSRRNIEFMRGQLKRLGYSYDWRREFATCDPEYYRWEQKIFIEMFERGLVEKQKAWVNWCDKCNTVLANEQVEDGFCWRHGDTRVRQKQLSQWFFKITKYAEELLEFMEKLPGWPEKVLTMQKNWIGKSVGAMIHFKLERPYPDPETGGTIDRIVVYTTRPDTLFGATFMSLAAEHYLCEVLSRGTEQEAAVREFCERVRSEDKIKRSAEDYVKEGVFTGAYCLNPVTGRRMPIYVANFVLMDYGTGAVMAVPAHDQRDFEFAKKYQLTIIPVVQPADEAALDAATMTEAYEGPGTMINSDEYGGMGNEEFKKAIAARLEKEMMGGATVNYRIRDWLISRQRYWGAPIPIVYCEKCGTVPVRVTDLPVALPAEVEFDVTGGSPLPKLDWWMNTSCPQCGGPARREPDTMDTFVESSWYYERYASPHCDTAPFEQDEVEYWLPVDQYIGGIEHAVLHLLYSRFYTKVLRDLGYVKFDEPFTRLLTQGMVLKESYKCAEHGYLFPSEVKDLKCPSCGKAVEVGRKEKMSKSKRNTVDPEEMVNKYGADTMRLYLLFEAPPDKEIDWSEERIQGMHRFLSRAWSFAARQIEGMKESRWDDRVGADFMNGPADEKALYQKTHQAIKDVTDRIERWMFNTAIASLMELFNAMVSFEPGEGGGRERRRGLLRWSFERFLTMLNPFCPHFAEELWGELGYPASTFKLPWPDFDPAALKQEIFELVLQVNGKLRAKVEAPVDAGEDELKRIALGHERIQALLDGKKPRKVVAVVNKLVNVVI